MSKIVATYTYTDAEALAIWQEALVKTAIHGQEYQVGGRTYTAVDAAEIRAHIEWYESRIASTENGIVTNYTRLVRR